MAGLSPGERDHSLAGGQAGLALLYAGLAAGGRRADAGALAVTHLDAAVATVATEETGTSLWGGFPGVALAAHLVDGWLVPQAEDRGGDIDEALVGLLTQERAWPAAHDLVGGLTGVGVYVLGRVSRPAAARCLGLVVARLAEAAHHDRHGIFWPTPPELIDPEFRVDFPAGWVDLGMAHGVAGAVALLGAVCAAGVDAPEAEALLDRAVSWLLAHAHPQDDGPTFPNWVAAGWQPRPARTAWCYGDPGVAAALLLAGRGAGRPEWEREGVALARRAAGRPAADTEVVAAGLCHGAAGLAHVYNRLHHYTGDPALGTAATAWLERTLDHCADHAPPGAAPWPEIDLVDGAAGVALVLLAAATAVEPVWDRMFLLSAPGIAPAAPAP